MALPGRIIAVLAGRLAGRRGRRRCRAALRPLEQVHHVRFRLERLGLAVGEVVVRLGHGTGQQAPGKAGVCPPGSRRGALRAVAGPPTRRDRRILHDGRRAASAPRCGNSTGASLERPEAAWDARRASGLARPPPSGHDPESERRTLPRPLAMCSALRGGRPAPRRAGRSTGRWRPGPAGSKCSRACGVSCAGAKPARWPSLDCGLAPGRHAV